MTQDQSETTNPSFKFEIENKNLKLTITALRNQMEKLQINQEEKIQHTKSASLDEISQLQNMVDNIYNDFVNLVSSNRKIEKNIIVNEIGAMIYNSKEAQKHYLIDGQKNINETIEVMAKELNLDNTNIEKAS